MKSGCSIFQIANSVIYLFKVKNRNTRAMGEIGSELTIKTPELRH